MAAAEVAPKPALVLCSQNMPVPQDQRVWREAKALGGAGYRVTVLCPRGEGQPRRETREGIEIHRYPAPPTLKGLSGQLLETSWSLVWVFLLALRLRLGGRLDVLHAANPPDTFFLVAWALRPWTRFVYDQHDLCPELLAARSPAAPSWLRRLLHRLELASYRRADLVIAPNNSYRGVALTRGGRRSDAVVVVRSGPDECVPRNSGASDRPLVVAFAGVMNEQDNVALLLEAAADVLQRRPGTIVVDLIGAGDDVPRLAALADERGLSESVRFAGWLEGDALQNRLGAASVGVSIDGDDEFSRLSTMAKVPDYLGLGLPVVLADLPENRVTAGDAAVYFRPGDADCLARCLEALLDDPGLLRRLEQEAARRGHELLWRHSAPRLVAAYAWLLHDGPPVDGEQVVAPTKSSPAPSTGVPEA